jgi:hypothetical protein
LRKRKEEEEEEEEDEEEEEEEDEEEEEERFLRCAGRLLPRSEGEEKASAPFGRDDRFFIRTDSFVLDLVSVWFGSAGGGRDEVFYFGSGRCGWARWGGATERMGPRGEAAVGW